MEGEEHEASDRKLDILVHVCGSIVHSCPGCEVVSYLKKRIQKTGNKERACKIACGYKQQARNTQP